MDFLDFAQALPLAMPALTPALLEPWARAGGEEPVDFTGSEAKLLFLVHVASHSATLLKENTNPLSTTLRTGALPKPLPVLAEPLSKGNSALGPR